MVVEIGCHECSKGEFFLEVRVVRLWVTLARFFQSCVPVEFSASENEDLSLLENMKF